ncbi:MAG: hypothetical protein ACFB6R_01125 [Alphaproteobacteria bacterium]
MTKLPEHTKTVLDKTIRYTIVLIQIMSLAVVAVGFWIVLTLPALRILGLLAVALGVAEMIVMPQVIRARLTRAARERNTADH